MCRNTASSACTLYDLPSVIGFSIDPRCRLRDELGGDLSDDLVDDLSDDLVDDLSDDLGWDLSGDAGDDFGDDLCGELGDDLRRRSGCTGLLVLLQLEVVVARRTLMHG